jgi:uncharacterized protein (TIGR00725 family)
MIDLQHKKPIAVIGGSEVPPAVYEVARSLGKALGRRGFLIICGGRTGVMEAVCRGCKEEDGVSIGVLPRLTDEANEYATFVVPTDLGSAGSPRCSNPETSRNRVVVGGALCVFAVDGGPGTANELKIAGELKKRVFGLCSPSEPENGRGPIWDAPGTGFTTHRELSSALEACHGYLRTKIPNLHWKN